jgi:Ni/Fe-hydrogenase subunit HybB-like protein
VKQRLSACAEVFGKPAAQAAALATLLGGLSLLAGLALEQRGVVLGALAASWLFLTGISAGGVALAAAIRLAQGRWAKGVLPAAEASATFFAPSLGLLALLALAARTWVPGAMEDSLAETVWIAARDVLAGVALYAVGRRFVSAARGGQDVTRLAVAYVLLYAVVMSLWSVDLVMRLHDWAPSTAIPAYYFMASLVTGLAWVTFVSAAVTRLDVSSDARHDAGKLLFGMTTFVAYLLWSIYLPTWYANISDETGQLLARWEGNYKLWSLLVIGMTFLLPFALLLTEAAKRNRALLAFSAGSILFGLFIERFLLVFPSLEVSPSPASFALAVGTVVGLGGLFVLLYGAELAPSTHGRG